MLVKKRYEHEGAGIRPRVCMAFGRFRPWALDFVAKQTMRGWRGVSYDEGPSVEIDTVRTALRLVRRGAQRCGARPNLKWDPPSQLVSVLA